MPGRANAIRAKKWSKLKRSIHSTRGTDTFLRLSIIAGSKRKTVASARDGHGRCCAARHSSSLSSNHSTCSIDFAASSADHKSEYRGWQCTRKVIESSHLASLVLSMAVPTIYRHQGLFSPRELWVAAMLLLLLLGAIASTRVARSAGTQAPAQANVNDLLQQMSDALDKLGNLQSALDKVRQGKTPTFDTPLGDAAQRLNKYAGELDAQNSQRTTVEVKPPPHKPGSALAEYEKYLDDLRSQRQQLVTQQQQISRQLERAQRMRTAADRLHTAIEKLASSGVLPETLTPYLLDSDQLTLALSSCVGSLKHTESGINSQTQGLTQRISNLDANLKDPRLREIIGAIDSSSATLNTQTSTSIQTTKSEIANRDRTNAANVQASLQPHPQPAPPASRPPQSIPNIPFPQPPGSNCPPGYQEMNGYCIALSMDGHP